MKMCPLCKEERAVTEFYKNSKRKDGLQVNCKTCKKKIDANYFVSNREKILLGRRRNKMHHWATRYKIPQEKLIEIQSRYNGKCWICQFREGTAVDHCHETNKVRGWLCMYCNTALGSFLDRKDLLLKAIDYLEEN
jgi:hypothetical protein